MTGCACDRCRDCLAAVEMEVLAARLSGLQDTLAAEIERDDMGRAVIAGRDGRVYVDRLVEPGLIDLSIVSTHGPSAAVLLDADMTSTLRAALALNADGEATER